MTKKTNIKLSVARKLGLAMLATGALTIAGGVSISPQAQAFGLGDITGAAKKVGKKAGYVAKHGGKMAGGFAKDAVKGVKTANDVINYVPNKIKKGVRDTALDAAGKAWGTYSSTLTNTYGKIRGINDENYQRSTDLSARQSSDFISGFGKRIDGYVGAAKRKTRKVLTEGITSGESLPRDSSVQRARRQTKSTKALKQYVNKNAHDKRNRSAFDRPAGNAKLGIVKGGAFYKSPQNVTRKSTASNSSNFGRPLGNFKTGVVRDKSFRGVNRKPIGHDKSVWGRPVGNKQQRKVQGITRGDLKPRNKRIRRKSIGRDRSVFGSPVVQNRNRKVSNRKLTQRSSGRKFQSPMRSQSNRGRAGNKMFHKNQQRNFNRKRRGR